jgi:hypothetical protein
LAESNPKRALELALAVDDPWYACQALAWVLRFAEKPEASKAAAEIPRRAALCRDDYQRSAVRAWEIRALVEKGQSEDAQHSLGEALATAGLAEPLPSRSEALFLIYQAAFPLGPRTVEPLVRKMVEVWKARPHWRSERNVVCALAILSSIAAKEAASVLDSLGDSKISARVSRQISLKFTNPRNFF